MPISTHHYSKEGLTVIWKPELCKHSTLCWKGLVGVFNPKEKPWVNLDGASKDAIIEQVKKCPSAALSYELEDTAADAAY